MATIFYLFKTGGKQDNGKFVKEHISSEVARDTVGTHHKGDYELFLSFVFTPELMYAAVRLMLMLICHCRTCITESTPSAPFGAKLFRPLSLACHQFRCSTCHIHPVRLH